MTADFARDQQKQNDRVDRIEEAPTVGLQRLSRVEEALAVTKDSLASINSKLDRALMRR